MLNVRGSGKRNCSRPKVAANLGEKDFHVIRNDGHSSFTIDPTVTPIRAILQEPVGWNPAAQLGKFFFRDVLRVL